MKKIFYIISMCLIVSCNQNKSKCDLKSIEIMEEYTEKIGSKYEYNYDLELRDFNRTCLNNLSVKELVIDLTKNKELKFPINTVRLFEYNGGGFYNELTKPSGCGELRFLIIHNIDKSGNFLDYEKVDIQ